MIGNELLPRQKAYIKAEMVINSIESQPLQPAIPDVKRSLEDILISIQIAGNLCNIIL